MNTYDVIVVGAGHNGLVAAAYLARAGLRVAIVESRSTVGGTFQTVRSSLGVGHNLHAVHLKFHLAPYENDLALSEAGAKFIYPAVKVGFGFADHSAFALYADPDATTASLGRISGADADRFATILPTWRRWFDEIVRPSVFTPPCDETGYIARIASSRYADLRRILTSTPAEYARTVFSDMRARRILTWALGAQGYLDDYRTLPPIALFTALAHLLFPMSLACGGTARVAEALARRVQSFGGDVLLGTPARKILTVAGRAIGIVLNDGRELRARRCILSAVNPAITFGHLLKDAPVPRHIRAGIERIQWDEWSLFGVHLVLREPPRHLFDEPNFDQAVKFVLPGDDTDATPTSHILREHRLRPVPRMGAGCLSLHDPSLSADGLHSGYAWEQVPFYLANSTWDRIREKRLAECLHQWRNVAPNLTGDNIVAAFAYTPEDIVASMPNLVEGGLNVGRITPPQVGTARPAPGLGGYRTCFEGLYLCGASCHPGGGATGAPGYVAARIVAEDLKLTPWWTDSFVES